MIESILCNILAEQLSVPVVLEVPEEKPASYVVLEKTGSSRRNRIDHTTVAIQSIAQTLYEAAELNEKVKEVMFQLPYLSMSVSGAELDSDYNFTDVESKERRYQAVFYITYKE